MKWLISRFKEPSTHASIAAGVGVLSTMFPQYAALLQALSGAFVAAGVVVKEAKVL